MIDREESGATVFGTPEGGEVHLAPFGTPLESPERFGLEPGTRPFR